MGRIFYDDDRDDPYDEEGYLIDGVGFADPGGRSALRAATKSNPRNLPCPTCGEPQPRKNWRKSAPPPFKKPSLNQTPELTMPNEITLEQATERAEFLFQMRYIEIGSEKIDTSLREITQHAAVVAIMSNPNREEAILALDKLIEALSTDLRINGQGMINDKFDDIRNKVKQAATEAAKPAMESFNAIMRAKDSH